MIKKRDIAWQYIGADKVYILKETDGTEYYLEGIAKEIWEMLLQGVDIHLIINKMANKFCKKENEIENDVKDFFLSLKGCGIIE